MGHPVTFVARFHARTSRIPPDFRDLEAVPQSPEIDVLKNCRYLKNYCRKLTIYQFQAVLTHYRDSYTS